MKKAIVAIVCILSLCAAIGCGYAQEQAETAPGGRGKIFAPKPNTEMPAIHQPDMGTGLIQVTLGLFVVLIIIGAAAWITRRFGHFQTAAGGSLRIVGGIHLSAREKLIVVQVGEEQLLLGVAPGRVSTLHVLGKPLSANETIQGNSSFLDKLNAALKRKTT